MEKTDLSCFYKNKSDVTSIDLVDLKTTGATSMSEMFYGCTMLQSLELSNFRTATVTDMSRMFYGCSSLTSLDLRSFNTRKVTDMSDMFTGCDSLKEVILSPKCSDLQEVIPENVVVTIYDKSKEFNMKQLDQISLGERYGVDVSVYKDLKYSHLQMLEIRLGLMSEVDVSIYAYPEFTNEQMKEIRLGLEEGIDVSSYANISVSPKDMKRMRESLTRKKILNPKPMEAERLYRMCPTMYKMTHSKEECISYMLDMIQ